MNQEHPRAGAGVVLVDLRHADAAARHGAVREAREQTQLSGSPRFLVVDDAVELVHHQLLYEQLFAYGPARVLCLAVGAPDEPWLRRPPALRPPNTGVLWIPDPCAGSRDAEDGRRAAALRPLTELLAESAVFDAVLTALGDVVHGTAVPAVRVVEHDLTEEAATRAWRQAIEGLVGQDVPPPALVADGAAVAGGDAVPAELAPLLGQSVPRSVSGRAWLLPDGPAALQHQRCDEALRDAVDGMERIRGAAGLYTPAVREVDLPARLEVLSHTLAEYRDTIAGALTDGGGDRLRPDQRSRLLKRGIELPETTEVSRAGVGPGLRHYAERLLGRKLPLRSVAARFAALADRSAPAGSAARLARLDEICPARAVAELAVPVPFMVWGAQYAEAALAFVVAAVAGLWPGVGWVSGPLTGLAGAGLVLLMLRHRPNRSYDGRIDGGGSARTGLRVLAGLLGGVAGAAVGQLVGLPLVAGIAALVLALTALAVFSVHEWTVSVDRWWAETDAQFAVGALSGLDELLAETVVHDWLFADARYHCSDGARGVAQLVRSLADTADERLIASAGANAAPQDLPAAQAVADSWSWDNWGDSAADDDWLGGHGPRGAPEPEPDLEPDAAKAATVPDEAPRAPEPGTYSDPPWLERERGDGGSRLVDTLVADLAHGVLMILGGRWAAIERDPATVPAGSLCESMDELLDEEHQRLLRDGAAAPPPFVPEPEMRPGAAELLGVSADHAGRLLGADQPDRAIALCRPEHRRLLSKDPLAERTLRFAPLAMRRGAEPDAARDGWHSPAEDVLWTPGGRHAGVLRLVPLRADTVRNVRTEEGEAP
ncbi:hypothetical protein ACFQVC_00965 [Streptomyces monticola]|uniref:Uncharacterized protein n=1 Tax=Streptomyces monticola TaxID=2666263 RepID=A0ABW2JBC7_9ACTN